MTCVRQFGMEPEICTRSRDESVVHLISFSTKCDFKLIDAVFSVSPKNEYYTVQYLDCRQSLAWSPNYI